MHISLPITGIPANDNIGAPPSPVSFASSPSPFPRPDHKAKRHGKPKPAKFRRRADRRSRMIEECGE